MDRNANCLSQMFPSSFHISFIHEAPFLKKHAELSLPVILTKLFPSVKRNPSEFCFSKHDSLLHTASAPSKVKLMELVLLSAL